MRTIEELVGEQSDAVSSASQSWDETTLALARQAPEGPTAYDIMLAELEKASDLTTESEDFLV